MRRRINDIKISDDFRLYEFQCRHCGLVMLHPLLLDRLQSIRNELMVPLTIKSGYRCPVHNKAVGGVPDSQHLLGTAADITSSRLADLRKMAEDYFKDGGVGHYQNTIHVDVRGERARWGISLDKGETEMSKFKDVEPGRWSARAIARMVRLGRLSGFSDRTFRPTEPLTREQYASSEDRADNYRFELIGHVKKSVCVVGGPGGQGSGVLIAPDTVITNVHVALTGYNYDTHVIDQLTVRFDDGTVIPPQSVKVPYGDGARDCAILKIPPVDIRPLPIADKVHPGEKVFAVGCPVGFISTVTEGMISHDRRMSHTMDSSARWIQTDASINPGNSGGALINMWGELVGMPTWKIFQTGESVPRMIEGMGFCLHKADMLEVWRVAEGGKMGISNAELANQPVEIIF